MNPFATLTLPHRVLVTGAGGGIGRALVLRLTKAGVAVIATDRGEAPPECSAAQWVRADLATGQGRRDLVAAVANWTTAGTAVTSAAHALGGVVHVAGVIDETDWDSIEESEVDTLLEVNIKAPFYLTRSLLEHFDGHSSVVLLGSIAGLRASPKTPFYAASKAALRNLGASMAVAWQSRGIRVNIVAPGLIDSPLTDALNARLAQERGVPIEAVRAERAAPIPAGRAGTPDDVVSACLFLLSSESTYCNGMTIHPSGGVMAGAI